MLYFHTYKSSPLQLSIDIVADIRRLNDMSVKSKKAGMIILGGGVCKHQIANAMLFVRNCFFFGMEGFADDKAEKWCRLRCVHQHRSGSK